MFVIKEILPNPSGDETQLEWIRIINQSDEVASARGLVLSDASGKRFTLNGPEEVAPQATIEIGRFVSRIALNNNGDSVYLHDKQGNLLSELVYTHSPGEDEIIKAEDFLIKTNTSAEEPLFQTNELAISNNYSNNLSPLAAALLLAVGAAWFGLVILNKSNDET